MLPVNSANINLYYLTLTIDSSILFTFFPCRVNMWAKNEVAPYKPKVGITLGAFTKKESWKITNYYESVMIICPLATKGNFPIEVSIYFLKSISVKSPTCKKSRNRIKTLLWMSYFDSVAKQKYFSLILYGHKPTCFPHCMYFLYFVDSAGCTVMHIR